MSTTSVASSATSAELLAAGSSRQMITVRNTDANTLYLLVGTGTASATNHTVALASGDYYELPHVRYAGALNGVWAADGSGAALITVY